MDKMREEFEAWREGYAADIRAEKGPAFSFTQSAVDMAQAAWQAARRPMPDQGEALKVGQRVRRLDGAEVIIDKDDGTNTPYRADGLWYRRDGTCPGAPERSLVLPIADPAPLASDSGRVAELERELNESDLVRERMARILDATANELKGHPADLAKNSWHDLAQVAADLRQQLAESREREGRMREAVRILDNSAAMAMLKQGGEQLAMTLGRMIADHVAALAADKEQTK